MAAAVEAGAAEEQMQCTGLVGACELTQVYLISGHVCSTGLGQHSGELGPRVLVYLLTCFVPVMNLRLVMP